LARNKNNRQSRKLYYRWASVHTRRIYIFRNLQNGSSAKSLINFSPFLPNGILGIFAAASFFYIAFEGSEIQVQAGEEMKNPARDLKIGLLTSWGIVSFIYAVISVIIIGATPANGGHVWEILKHLQRRRHSGSGS